VTRWLTDAPVETRLLEFLRRPESYPEQPQRVSVLETHMSWVFLLDRSVYKLKKPVARPFLDFRSVAARRRFCLEEVRLNRVLAASVYFGAVPIVDSPGGLQIGGIGPALDWLVHMRRLPEDRMLDRVITTGNPQPSEIDRLCRLLARFYRAAPRRRLSAKAYMRRLWQEIAVNERDLTDPRFDPGSGLVRRLCAAQRRFLRNNVDLLAARSNSGHLVDGHGDLRPEHICLEPQPVVIDRLEFEPAYRIVDPVDELAYLAMECERLGAGWVGAKILREYLCRSGNRVPWRLIEFYACLRACQRARFAIMHLWHGDPGPRARWIGRAREYLAVAARRMRRRRVGIQRSGWPSGQFISLRG
jgi:aminoglycoside phosphotransferase family enzyme